ncbi:hypothetical protein ACP70R_024225 [Stipagrostis hirtigluma subsp. patula]
MASGAASSTLKVVTIATLCLMILLSSSPGLAQQRLCSNCEKDCRSSCSGGTGCGNCGICCTEPKSDGCKSCKDAYYAKCMNYCVNDCYRTRNCTSG